jgi:hypothetical protein
MTIEEMGVRAKAAEAELAASGSSVKKYGASIYGARA